MSPEKVVTALLNGKSVSQISDVVAVRAILTERIKAAVRHDTTQARQIIEAIKLFAKLTGRKSDVAFAYMAVGNLNMLALGDYTSAITAYDAAARVSINELEAAKARIGKIGALVQLGSYQSAEEIGNELISIFQKYGAREQLAGVLINLAFGVHIRRGNDQNALNLMEQATLLLPANHLYQALIEQNRSIPLRHLGRFKESLEASRNAYQLLTAHGATSDAIRSHQNAAITNFTLGNYNEALKLFEEVRTFWLADGRQRDAIVADLVAGESLLQLHRYAEVVTICERIIDEMSMLKLRGEMVRTWLLLARALAGLNQTESALNAIVKASALLDADENLYEQQIITLEHAALLLQRGENGDARQLVNPLRTAFGGRIMPQLRAELLFAAASLQSPTTAERIEGVIVRAKNAQLNAVLYHAYELLGDWHFQQRNLSLALINYKEALDIVESLIGHLMIEFRITFAEGTFNLYEKATSICIEQKNYSEALLLAERAKSRALLEIISHRLDIGIHVRQADDQPLVDELLALRQQRDILYRQLGSHDDLRLAISVSDDQVWQTTRRQINQYEQQITDLWHQLLIRNAEYTADAQLWRVQPQSFQTLIDDDTLLIEYFSLSDQFVVFLVSAETVEIIQLDTTADDIMHWLQFFRINCQRIIPNQHSPKLVAALTKQSRQLLQKLYRLLVAPIATTLTNYTNLIIVPHDALHYLPFHALHDGAHYLIEQHAISYLPSASLLSNTTCTHTSCNFVAFGYSNNQQIVHSTGEAIALAKIMRGRAFIEEDATLHRFRQEAEKACILHLATHGEFNADNALFSGLTLYDGQLVTLDIFNLRLNAALVTLSACQTGQNIVSKGNELLGLMRGFLAAGAESLLLTQWSVEDASTAQLMTDFYRHLGAGAKRSVALQRIQMAWACGEVPQYAHPYYWAPFFLVGETGKLNLTF